MGSAQPGISTVQHASAELTNGLRHSHSMFLMPFFAASVIRNFRCFQVFAGRPPRSRSNPSQCSRMLDLRLLAGSPKSQCYAWTHTMRAFCRVGHVGGSRCCSPREGHRLPETNLALQRLSPRPHAAAAGAVYVGPYANSNSTHVSDDP